MDYLIKGFRRFVLLILFPLAATCMVTAETIQPEEISSLIEQLGDDKEIVRLEAKDSLIDSGQRAVNALIEALRNNRSSTVRYHSAWVLGDIGGKSVREILSEIAGSENDSDVRDSTVLAVVTIILAETSPSASRKQAKKLIKKESISELHRMLVESRNSVTRRRSAKILGRISDKSLLRSLKKEMENNAGSLIRSHICQALGWLASMDMRTAISILMKAADDDAPEVRREAILQLGTLARIGKPERVRFPVSSRRTVQTENRATGKLEDCRTSLRTFDESITRKLIKSLKEDPADEVRKVSADVLREVAQQILEYIKNLPARWTPPKGFPLEHVSQGFKAYRREAAESVNDNLDLLEDIFTGYSASLKKEKQPVIRKEIVLNLGDLSAGMANLINVEPRSLIGFDRSKQISLEKTRDVISSVLLKLLDKEKNITVRREIVSVLPDFNNSTAARAIAGVLINSRDPELRVRAVESLERQGGRSAEKALLNVMTDSRTGDGLRKKIIAALGHLQSGIAVSELIAIAAGEGNIPIRSSAVTALGQIGDTTALPAVIAVSGDPDVSLRLSAVSALSRLGGNKAVNSLILRLRVDEDCSIRIRVVELLPELAGKQALPALREALGDIEPSVRKTVVRTIGEIGSKNSLIDILNILSDDKDITVRAEAVTVARLLGDKRAVPALISSLHDSSELVRARAAEELSRIRDGRACSELFRVWKTDKSPEVKAAARRAICRLKPFCRSEYERMMREIEERQ